VASVFPAADREDGARGERQRVLQLAAGLGAYLQPALAMALEAAAREENIVPAHVEAVVTQDATEVPDAAEGVVAQVEGRQLALGPYRFLLQLGLVPQPADVHVARRIAALGNTALYLMLVDAGRCLGLVGVEMRQTGSHATTSD
jgi:cation transport ATPase